MSLNSSMQKIIDFTSKLNGYLDLNNLIDVKVPGGKLAEMVGWEEGEGIQSVGDLVRAVEDVGGLVATGANLVRCGYTIATSDQYKNFLGSMAMGVTNVIVQITDEIWNAVAAQINQAVMQVVGTITNIITALNNLWTSIELLWEGLKKCWDDWMRDIEFNIGLELDAKNCADMYAAIGGCLLNKFLGPYIDEFKEKALKEINETGKSFNDLLYEEMADANAFAAYANHEAFLLNKAELQIKGLTRENLLGV